jgi:hypothetical protein
MGNGFNDVDFLTTRQTGQADAYLERVSGVTNTQKKAAAEVSVAAHAALPCAVSGLLLRIVFRVPLWWVSHITPMLF